MKRKLFWFVGIALVGAGFIAWRLLRTETLEEAVKNYVRAFDERDYATMARYTTDRELKELAFDRAQYTTVLRILIEEEVPIAQKAGPIKYDRYADVGCLTFSQEFKTNDGRQSVFTGNFYLTDEGPKIIPSSSGAVGYAMCFSIPQAELPVKAMKIRRWVEWYRNNKKRLDRVGLRGFYRVASNTQNPTGTGNLETWDSLANRYEQIVARIEATGR